ncbi:MAG: excinuclease ABC subunit UvrC [Lachnospiraceae bacterium]|jgi:excinuclease ABC subunit C|nr:excinuclease ABC subunit UvrC [Lachnospiraceae bacterium]
MKNEQGFDFEEELQKLPGKPGVYIMHGQQDEIIYVGKAISLKNRVRQYFRKGADGRAKIEKMMPQVTRFEYIVTDSELEALVLENNLIKEHTPKYNTLLKDGKTYPFIKVTLGDAYPRLVFSRQMKKDKSKYFGPYTSSASVRDTIDLLQKLYHLRSCNRVLPRDTGKDRPCLNYHIKQCDAPCQGYISQEEYKSHVDQALLFLNGNYDPIRKLLEEKMLAASENMEFEEAAGYRDLLNSVNQVAQKQKITNSDFEDRDVVAMAMDKGEAVVQVFFVRDGKLMGREHFYMTLAPEDTEEGILGSFLSQYYGGTPFLPKEIMMEKEPENREELETWLTNRRGNKVSIKIPKIGQKEKLVELAAKNALLVLAKDRERLKREEARTLGAMKEIADLLELPMLKRVEAFDISNISGFLSVGSMVVFEDGRPKKNDYRKFRLKTVTGPDDYASMYEVLSRRFSHGIREQEELAEKGLNTEYGRFSKLPDLIMMDGGRGQVNIAQKVLEELHLSIPVCGMVKDDNHRTRGLYFQNLEVPMDTSSEAFKLITRVQDEAHRFAIEFHRSLRGKNQVKSVLDEIEGIGPKRRRALMKHFASLDEIKEASVEQLREVDGFNSLSAQSVYDFFHVEQS